MKKIFYIQKYALWQQSEEEQVPNVGFIPPLLRRRLTGIEKIGLFLAHQLAPVPKNCQVVFASRFGEWQQTIDLIRQYYSDKEMSPAGFSHSVHNAMPGLLSILTQNKDSYTSIAAKENTIESGLLETFCTSGSVLFIYAEEKTPDLYCSRFSKPFESHGVAFVVSEKEQSDFQKISVETDTFNQPSVTFSDLRQFLVSGGTLQGNHLTLRKIK